MHKGQTNGLLGYPADARLLIINADDFGMCHAINEAIVCAFQKEVLRSTTLMVPSAWSLHAMHFLADHPEISFGVHLSVIADGIDYRWRPVSSRGTVPSLVDEAGYFYHSEHMFEFLSQVRLDQLELEFRAQIDAVLASGLAPTHLDWHSLRIGGRPDITDVMVKLAKEYGVALRVAGRAQIEQVQSRGLPTNDYDFLDSYTLDVNDKPARYAQLLRELPAGLSEWAVHPGRDNAELRAIDPKGTPVRQTDFDFLMSQEAQEIVQEEGIILLDYRPLQTVWAHA